MTTSILFIDSNVIDYETLLAGLPNDVEVHVLNAKEDGVLQMAAILQGRTGIDSIQIVSHGSSGSLTLGSGVLNNENLNSYQNVLKQIGSSLSASGDILLYGCDVAQGDTGLSFINQLGLLTGADVAASNDLTGAANKGGDWGLEAQTGSIEAHSLQVNGYSYTLSIPSAGAIYDSTNGHYYQLISSSQTFDNAVTAAAVLSNAEWNAYLVTINDAAEQDFIINNLGMSDWEIDWIGGKQISGANQWLTGETFSYSNFDAGQPITDGYGFDMTGAGYGSVWHTELSSTMLGGYIVEYEPNLINHAPTATNATLTTNEDTSYILSTADFGYNDVDGNAMANVKITSLTTAGTLALNGTAVILNQIIPTASIPNLTFTPAVNANGTSYDGFNFTVNDGSLDSMTANTMTFNVTAVPDVNISAGATPVEGSTTGTFTVTLDSPAPAGGLVVNYDLTGSSATLTTDYSITAGTNISNVTANTFTIAQGTTSATLNVNAVADGITDANETVKLHLNPGAGYQLLGNTLTTYSTNTFLTKTDYSTGATPYSLNEIDVNGDGKLDLVIANAGENSVSVYTRNAANTDFDARVDYPLSFSPRDVTVGDFNGDGKTDLALTDPSTDTVSVLLANPDYTFSTITSYSTGSYAHYVTTGDFNNDGKLDLAVTNAFGNSVSVLLRSADNSGFDTQTSYLVGTVPYAITTGDFNHDGKLDIATANSGSGDISVLFGNSNGFDAAINYATGASPFSVTAGDFNGDGQTDLAVANYGESTVSVLLRKADNSGFDTPVNYAASNPTSVMASDFNNDGKADLAVVNSGNNTVSVLLRNATNDGFDVNGQYAIGAGGYAVNTGDLDNDGKPDLAVANSGDNSVSVLLNNFNPSSSLIITDMLYAPTATNLSTAESYTEDTPLNLTDIVVTDIDSANVTATLTLSNTAAGSLNTATSGVVTSTYDAGTGVWSVSGAIADVNALLADVTFNPTANFNSNFTINTSISDGSLSVSGVKSITGTPVNDAPTFMNNTALAISSGGLSSSGDLTTTSPTLEADILWDGTGGVGNYPVLLYNGSTSTSGYGLIGQILANGTMDVYVLLGGITANPIANIAANTWTHLGISLGSDNVTYNYVVGSTVGSITLATPGTQDSAIQIGDSAYSNNEFHGLVDNIAVWNTALSASQMASHGTLVGNEANLAGLWTLENNFNNAVSGGQPLTPSSTTSFVTTAPAILAAGTEDTAYIINANDLLQGFSDVDGDTLNIANLAANNGTLVNNNNGTWTFTPAANYNGTVALTYNVIDGNGGSIAASQNFDLTVVPDVNVSAGVTPIEGSTTGTFIVTLDSPAPAGGLVVNYNLTGSTATATTDYTITAGTNIIGLTDNSFTIAAGQTTAALNVNAVADGISDANETVQLNLVAGSGYTTSYPATTSFANPVSYATGVTPRGMATFDYNGDGKLDLLVTNQNSNTVSVFLGDGAGNFSAGTAFSSIYANPISIAKADFNADGKLDFVVSCYGSNALTVFTNNGNGTYSNSGLSTGANPHIVKTADLNNDGYLDIVSSNAGGSISIFLNNGNGSFNASAISTVPTYGVTVADFNNDGNQDLAITDYNSGYVKIYTGNGIGNASNFTYATQYAVGANPVFIASGDINNDGKIDLVAANYGSNTVSVLLNTGTGATISYAATNNIASGNTAYSVELADINNDGKLDIVTNSTLLLGDGAGNFTVNNQFVSGITPLATAIADFNGDGKLDYAASNGYSNNQLNVFLNNSNPTGSLTITDDQPPILTSISLLTGTEDTEATFTLADLQTHSDASDVDGVINSFVVKATSSGTLKIGTSSATATAWAAGSNDIIDATHNAYWTADANANGVLNAFTVVAKDNGGLESATAIQTIVNVSAVNHAPTATNLNTPETYTEDTPLNLVDTVISDVDTTIGLRNGLNFDGINDYVGVNNAPELQLSNGTIEAWIKTADAGSNFRGIAVKQLAYGLFLLDNQLATWDWTTGTVISTGINLADNQWHHVAMSFVSGVANGTNFYIDGVLRLTTTYTVSSQTNAFEIGAGIPNGTGQNFAGSIDEVRVWNTVRTQAQIQASINTELAGNETGLVSYYDFNQGVASGTNSGVNTVTDKTAHLFNGTLNNFALTGATSNWVTGAQGDFVSATLTLSNPAAGVLNTATLGLATSTYDTTTGIWTASGKLADVNTLLAGVIFTPAANFNSNFTISSNISDGSASVSGSQTFTGVAVNDAPVLNIAAAHFNGVNQYVDLPDITLGSTVTIDAWVNVTQHSNWSRIIELAIPGAERNGNILLSFYGTTGKLVLEANNGTTMLGQVIAPTALSTGAWHHVASVINGTLATIYIDGIAVGSTTLSEIPVTATRADAYIGRSHYAADSYFNGSIRDLHIWNTAQTADQIAADMYTADVSGQAGLVASYNLQNSFVDNSSNHLDGTAINGAAIVGNTVAYTENSAAVTLSSYVTVGDAELNAIGDYNGAILTLARNGGANAQDVFSSTGFSAGNVIVSGITIGTFSQNAGMLTVSFNANATQNLVNSALQQIQYSNSSDAPPASVQINWILNDGAGGSSVSSTNVIITPVNDAPIGSASATLATGIENTSYTLNATQLLQGFSDVEGDSLTIANLTANNGTLVNNNNGTWTLTPNSNYLGTVALSYNVIDGHGGSIAGSQNFTLVMPNIAPVLSTPATINYTDTVMVDNFAAVTDAVTATDINGDTLSYGILGGTVSTDGTTVSMTNSYGTLTITTATGAYNFEPNQAGIEALVTDTATTFTITVSDGALTNSQSLTINITQSGITESLGNDVLIGTVGDDTLNGLAGADTMIGDLGNDVYYVDNTGDVVTETSTLATEIDTINSSINYALPANVENLTLIGTAAINAIGNKLNNVLIGNSANNVLNGGLGADTMIGGLGNDTYYVNVAGDTVTEAANAGIDTIVSSLDYTLLGTEVENLTLSGAIAINGVGNSYNNSLVGNTRNNVLSGGDGNDYLNGGLGNDTLDGGNGIDTANYAYLTASNSVNATLDASGNGTAILTGGEVDTLLNIENIIGGAGNDTLTGNSANNTLNGGLGADTLVGSAGNDTYYVDNTGDVVTEIAGEGIDSVNSSVDYTLAAEVESLTLTGSVAINGTGNNLNNGLTGNALNNVLSGGDGNDYLTGGLGNDTLDGGLGNDIAVFSGTFANASISYASSSNIFTITTANGGIDTVSNIEIFKFNDKSVAAYTAVPAGSFDAYFYLAKYAGVRNAFGADKALATKHYVQWGYAAGMTDSNVGNDNLMGSTANDSLNAGAGNDILNGGVGADTLIGGTGNDILNGGVGADTLIGGTGNDTYYVDNTGDVIVEAAGEGTDTVNSSVDYTLAAEVDNLTLTGSLAINGIGNNLNNRLTGNDLNNVLSAGDGNDYLTGGLGNDTLDGGLGNDTAVFSGTLATASISYAVSSNTFTITTANGGVDTVSNIETFKFDDQTVAAYTTIPAGSFDADFYLAKYAGVRNAFGTDKALATKHYVQWGYAAGMTDSNTGNDSLVGSTANDSLNGGAGNDAINGGVGDDTLCGGTGNDTLTGDLGADIFQLLTLGDVDTIKDFSVVDDTMQLEHTAFTSLNVGVLSANSLRAGAGMITAADADDFLIYNSSTGSLYYDADGSGAGAAVKIAILGVNLAVTNADFVII